MRSSSRMTLRSEYCEGILKCFRYQAAPVYVPVSPLEWLARTRYESTSLYVCGVLTVVHALSLNATACAPATSCRMNCHPGSMLNCVLSWGGGGRTPPSGAGGAAAPSWLFALG